MSEKEKKSYDVIVMGGGQIANLTPHEALNLGEEVTQQVKEVLRSKFPDSDLDVSAMVEESGEEITPEQYARNLQQSSDIKEEWKQTLSDEARKHLNRDFEIAEEWVNKPGLSVREVAHGVVWGIHNAQDEEKRAREAKRQAQLKQTGKKDDTFDVYQFQPEKAPIYSDIYQERHASRISVGEIMSAKDLFS